MTLLTLLERALLAGKEVVLSNLHRAAERTGDTNPFGDKTLLLDKNAEDAIIASLRDSGTSMTILTEEQGSIQLGDSSDYIVIIDPIDGSANMERGIPLCTTGITAAPYSEEATTDDLQVSVIDSFFTDEMYVAQSGKGVTRNGRPVEVSEPIETGNAIISYDTKKEWDAIFTSGSTRVLQAIHDSRRTASNLLDLCWVAAGSLDAMVDLRGILPIVHVCGTHMVQEAGGCILDKSGYRLRLPLDLNRRMSFVAASDECLARDILRAFHDE